MANSLVFPAGVSLLTKDELSGPEDYRNKLWARVQSANIAPGYSLRESDDSRFSFYAEINVDAPFIWEVFCDLCRGLLGNEAGLVMGEIDDEPRILGDARTTSLLGLLEPHAYQLTNDGWIQFGLVDEQENSLSEVFIAPTKHFQVWFTDVQVFRSIMKKHGLLEDDHLEFLDQYPRTTSRLPDDKVMFQYHTKLIEYFQRGIGKA
jgi:hypothetical protein